MLDDLVSKTASSRSAESFMQQAPSVHACTASASTTGCLGAPKRQGALPRKGAQGHPGSRLPLISPSGGCRRRTASLPARSSAARAASRPATSSGILTDVTVVPPPASKPASTGPKGMSPSSTIWKAKLLIAQVGSTPRSVSSNDAFRPVPILTDSFLIFALQLISRPLPQCARLPHRLRSRSP